MAAESKYPPPTGWHGLDDPYVQLVFLLVVLPVIVGLAIAIPIILTL